MSSEIGGHGHPCPRTPVSAPVHGHGHLKNRDRGHGRGHGHQFFCNRGHGRGHDHLLFQKVLSMGTKVLMSWQLCKIDLFGGIGFISTVLIKILHF